MNPQERLLIGLLVVSVGVVLLITLVSNQPNRVPIQPRGAPVMGLALPTPPAGAATIYRVTNANATALDVLHTISDPFGFRHSFWTLVPAGGDVTIHLRDIPEVPSPFQGEVQLAAALPFAAELIGYDLAETPTPGPSPISTSTPTLTPSPVATQTPLNSPTATLTPTVLSLVGLEIHWGCRIRTTGVMRDTGVEVSQPHPGCPATADRIRVVVGH